MTPNYDFQLVEWNINLLVSPIGLLASKMIFLDYHQIEDGIIAWRDMQSHIDIQFLGRGTGFFWLLYNDHWAWLLIGETFFCTIEYGIQGILIQYFEHADINRVSAAILGNSKDISYNDTFQTNMSFADILNYINQIKGSWRASDFNIVSNNCQHFVQELGEKMDSSFKGIFLKERSIR